ncbi:DUF2474 domain-containing protein [Kerstersia gyiorum]|nr:DUF2474 domain-containing protein [Kerstersia gyiorum]
MMGKPAASSWQQRLAWLLGIWLVSVLVLAGMAYGMRLLMSAAGMTATGQSAYSATHGSAGRQVAGLLMQPHGAIAAVTAQATPGAGPWCRWNGRVGEWRKYEALRIIGL